MKCGPLAQNRAINLVEKEFPYFSLNLVSVRTLSAFKDVYIYLLWKWSIFHDCCCDPRCHRAEVCLCSSPRSSASIIKIVKNTSLNARLIQKMQVSITSEPGGGRLGTPRPGVAVWARWGRFQREQGNNWIWARPIRWHCSPPRQSYQSSSKFYGLEGPCRRWEEDNDIKMEIAQSTSLRLSMDIFHRLLWPPLAAVTLLRSTITRKCPSLTRRRGRWSGGGRN